MQWKAAGRHPVEQWNLFLTPSFDVYVPASQCYMCLLNGFVRGLCDILGTHTSVLAVRPPTAHPFATEGRVRRLEGTSAPSKVPVEDQEDEVQTEKRDQSKEKEKGAEKEKKGSKAQGGKVEEKQEKQVVPKDLEASTDGFSHVFDGWV